MRRQRDHGHSPDGRRGHAHDVDACVCTRTDDDALRRDFTIDALVYDRRAGSARFFRKMGALDKKTKDEGTLDDIVLMTALLYEPLEEAVHDVRSLEVPSAAREASLTSTVRAGSSA